MKKVIVHSSNSIKPLEFEGNYKIAFSADAGVIVIKDEKGDYVFIGSKETCFAYIEPDKK